MAFTLIELLIVVAIIAILAAIAVPNFLEAQTRAKVARVEADMRSMATAFEAYRVDHNNYPPRFGDEDVNLVEDDREDYGSDYQPAIGTRIADKFGNRSMALVTTPIAYITTLPYDPFQVAAEIPPNLRIIDYFDEYTTRLLINVGITVINPLSDKEVEQGGYVLTSFGPYGTFGSTIAFKYDYPFEPIVSRRTFMHQYDPTNGTTSIGNIYRFSQWQSGSSPFFQD